MNAGNPLTREELEKKLTINIHDETTRRAFLSDPRTALSLDVCHAIGGRVYRCVANAEDGYDHLRTLVYDVRIALGFLVKHEYWRIQVMEHAWLVVRDENGEHIIDPTLPFITVKRWPSYFEGAVSLPGAPYPTLRNKKYKAAFLAAKHLANTCEYPYMDKAERRVHILRMTWLKGPDAAEGSVAR